MEGVRGAIETDSVSAWLPDASAARAVCPSAAGSAFAVRRDSYAGRLPAMRSRDQPNNSYPNHNASSRMTTV